MKWCFLLNDAPFMMEFLGKLSYQAFKEGDNCIIAANSKIAEFSKRQYFPKDAKIFSKVDWCIENYKKNQREFGDLSWKILFPEFERLKLFKFNYENSVEMVFQMYQFIDSVFEKEKPDIVINEAPANLFTEIAYRCCQKYDITYFGLISSRLSGRIDIFDREHTCSKYEKTFNELAIKNNASADEKKFAQDFVDKFLSHEQLPSYMKYQNKDISLGIFGRIKRYLKREKQLWRCWFRYFAKRKYFRPFDDYSEMIFQYNLQYPIMFLKRGIQRFLKRNVYDSLGDNDKFFLFPLQVQPEASTSVLATYFCDQINTVKNAAFSLPFPYKLYVKEHPAALGERTADFYCRLKKIPNVVLVSPFEKTEDLIKRSQGVITLTSTIGMEAVLAGKVAYVFGNVFYSYHPGCVKISSFEELEKKIRENLAKSSLVPNLENINSNFIISYFRNTILGDLTSVVTKKDTNNYQAIYQSIKKLFLEV